MSGSLHDKHQKFAKLLLRLDSNFVTDIPYTSDKLIDIEKAVRAMAREDRYSRRLLSISLVDFLQNSKSKKLKSRICDSSLLDVLYVFLITTGLVPRKLAAIDWMSEQVHP